MMRAFARGWVPAFLILAFLGAVATADERPGVLIVLDASGSMAESLGKGTKIDAARKVLREVIPSLPEEIDVGFAAYGHRRKGDCTDIELLVPLGGGDREAILKKAAKLSPKGKTPLAASVEQLAGAIRNREGETTIVLVSDGKDTCSPDPCAAIRKLKETGVKFVLHVVGFAVSDAERDQLRCIAEAGGGLYFGAKDAAALLEAFKSVQRDVEERASITPAQATPVPVKSKIGKLHIVLPGESAKSVAAIRIVAKDGKTVKTVERPGADSVHALPAGEYSLVFGYANPNYQPPTEVEIPGATTVAAGEEATVTFGALVFNIAESLGDAVADVRISDGEEGVFSLTNEYHGNGYYLFTPKPLPKGKYEVAFRFSRNDDFVPVLRDVEIESGKESVATFDSGIVIAKPQEGGVTGWDLVPSESTQPWLRIARRRDNDEPLWRHFPVPPGTYDIVFHVEGMDAPLVVGEKVEIEQGQIVNFDSGM